MSFVGVICIKKEFDFIQKEVKKINNKNINLIHINSKSIKNIKNVKFDVIVIDKKIDEMNNNDMENVLSDIKYLIINSDIEIKSEILKKIKTNIINYGLNQKATVTASSINDENIIICLQRSIKNISRNIIEPNEIKVRIEQYKNKRIYNILIVNVLKILYE